MEDAKMKELEELCRPVAEYLKKNYNPYYSVSITSMDIKVVSAEIFIPLETAQEVPVQEQLVECGSCYKDNNYLAKKSM